MLLLVSIWFRISGCELFLEAIFTYSGFRSPDKKKAAFAGGLWFS
jgi:hypothetical protein